MKKIIVSFIVTGLLLSVAPLCSGGEETVDDFDSKIDLEKLLFQASL